MCVCVFFFFFVCVCVCVCVKVARMDDKALSVRGQVVGSHMPHALSPPIDLLSPPPTVQDRLTDRPLLLYAHLCFQQSPVVHSLAFYSFSLTLCTHIRRPQTQALDMPV